MSEAMQAAYRDHRPCGTRTCQRRLYPTGTVWCRYAFAQLRQVVADHRAGYPGRISDAAVCEVAGVAAQVAAVRSDRVPGHASLHGQMVEVGLDESLHR